MKKTNDNRTTDTTTDVEPYSRHAPLGEEETQRFASPVRIAIHSVRNRLADPDGISGKAVIDGIVGAGILSDDSPKQIEEVRFTQSKGKRERTVIVIEEA
jgi:hypothetical protein